MIEIDQLTSVPVLPLVSSLISSVQVPEASPVRVARLPSGWKLPVKG